MTRLNLLLGAAITAISAVVGAQAYANPIYLGASFNGGPITDLASGEGSAGVNGYRTGTYNISFSATGRSTRARASVVVIRPCSNSAVARFETISFWWAGLPPRRAPFLGVGMVFSQSLRPCQVPG